MRAVVNIILAAMLGLGFGPAAYGAAVQKAPKPIEAIEPANCVTAECHANIKQYKVLHGPVNANTCDACHELVDAKEHKFQPTRQKAELCTFCHDFKVDKMPVVHEPVRRGECLGCHDPHGGNTDALTLGQTTPELCGRCHESVTKNKKFLHGPAASGDCNSCHRPHASRFPMMLDAEGPDLCLTCHTRLKEKLAAVRFPHKALEEGCDRCHDAHGSNHAMDLTQASSDLCLSCHDKVKDEIAKATYKHSVVTAERGCVMCHTPHGSDLAKMMSDYPLKICMDCHSQAVKAADGRVIAAVPELNDPRTIKHGPIKDGQCTGCHRTHGGQRPMLLVKDYSEAFYQRYNPANYDLCFSCHDVNLAQQEQSKGLTGFRDGDRNLHFVHVDKSDRSRNCGVCHSTHASANPRHMRDWTLFGKWKLPIGFTKTANGGTCESGCHGTFSYDRVHPVGPATQPVRLATRVVAAAAPPPTVHWNVQDATGAKITVPAAGRTAVLVFIRAEADPQDILKLVSQAITPQRSAQALVIVGGAQAADRTKALVQARATPWPIVADADCLLSRQLGLYAWPATLVIQPDGTQLAHLSGTPQHLTAELEAYLDFAAGRIDQAMLNRKLATRQVADDGADKKVAAYHDLAELLMAEGKPEQARVMLVDALKLRPDLPSLQVSMVKALLQLKRTDDAAAVLNKLPPGATPDWQRNLLRARLLLARNQWQQAKAALADVLKARPDLSEAHYAMAEIYEHERDWQKAAESYRAARAAERK